MKRYLILLCALGTVVFAACRQENDTRFFAPEVGFDRSSYDVKSDVSGGLDVSITLSRPATEAMTVGVNAVSSLKEDLQFRLGAHSFSVPEDATGASLHIDLIDGEIWDNESWIDLILSPGTRYTLNPDANSIARVNVSKDVVLPKLSLVALQNDLTVNPFLPESINIQMLADRATTGVLDVDLALGDLVCGRDYLINGSSDPVVKYPAGARSATFELQLLRQDVSGMDKHVTLSIIQKKGAYVAGDSDVNIHLSDPVVDFSPIFLTPAAQNGQGYQIRQAFKKADGSWDGNTNVDLGVSSEGSNYLRNFRNLYNHPSFSCLANASVSQFLRMSELFPNHLYPNKDAAILDYGNDQGHRHFSPADSLLRFVLDKGETKKGTIHLARPRTFKAYIGSYDAWQDKSVSATNAWVLDSRATGGNIDASSSPAITGVISVTLEKLEGTFDFSNKSEPVLITAWLRSDSEQFLKADTDDSHPTVADPLSTWNIVGEDGLWKIEYKLWPR